MSEPLILTASFIMGTVFGSFFHTLALRIARGSFNESWFHGLVSPSACQACGHKPNPAELIPVFGYILCRGRCRSCGAAIPIHYFLMEVIYGITALLTAHISGVTIESISTFLVMGTGIAVATADVQTMRIPFPLVALMLLIAAGPSVQNQGFIDTAGGFLLIFLFFGLILFLFPGSFGGGDLWYGAAIGLLLGFELSVVLLEVSLVSGALYGTAYAIMTKKGFRSKIPFAPFLTLGFIAATLFGRNILFIYYDIFF